jgi:hypothetical protein
VLDRLFPVCLPERKGGMYKTDKKEKQMNVPVPETERLADKVREKKMGELFADMEK